MSVFRHIRARCNYLIGFVLAALLTVTPFAAVAFDLLSTGALYIVIGVAAVVQVLVHLR